MGTAGQLLLCEYSGGALRCIYCSIYLTICCAPKTHPDARYNAYAKMYLQTAYFTHHVIMCQTITATRPSSWVYGTERDYLTTLRGSMQEKSRENNRFSQSYASTYEQKEMLWWAICWSLAKFCIFDNKIKYLTEMIYLINRHILEHTPHSLWSSLIIDQLRTVIIHSRLIWWQ